VADAEVPDYFSRTPEGLAAIFRHFGETEAPPLNSPLYGEFSFGVAGDADLLDISSHATRGNNPPNMLFAAAHYLLLKGEQHPLRQHYPALADGTAQGSAFAHFRDFVLKHRDEVVELVSNRRVQTNVMQRAVCLLPAFAEVLEPYGDAPLSLIEVGTSAGLNLNWDRFAYEYRRDREVVMRWGPESAVKVDCELRGAVTPRLPAADIQVASRVGVDINPIDINDEDAVLWLRSLIWPEHVPRHERLSAAIALAAEYPVDVREGDAVELLPGLLEAAPEGSQVVVFATIVLYQFTPEARKRLFATIAEHSRERPVTFVTMDTEGGPHSFLRMMRFAEGERTVRLLGHCNPHGHWLEWLAPHSRPIRR
jgi:hypothetical protein